VRARPRTQSSLAIRGADGPWYLVNASPDLRQQLETLEVDDSPSGLASMGGLAQMARPPAACHDNRGIRTAPIAGVLLTDAEIDHTAGLLLLRESPAPIQVYGDPEIEQALRPTLLRMLDRFAGVRWHEIGAIDGLAVERLRPGVLVFREGASVFTYAPALADLDDAVLEQFAASDLVFVDGTFWFGDDLARLGISQRTAADMGHVPLTLSLDALAALDRPRVVLVHINNTNPILLEDSPERAQVVKAGLEVAYDGLEVQL
jgi:pyrroloquinoline quinone biosynthesis protein B